MFLHGAGSAVRVESWVRLLFLCDVQCRDTLRIRLCLWRERFMAYVGMSVNETLHCIVPVTLKITGFVPESPIFSSLQFFRLLVSTFKLHSNYGKSSLELRCFKPTVGKSRNTFNQGEQGWGQPARTWWRACPRLSHSEIDRIAQKWNAPALSMRCNVPNLKFRLLPSPVHHGRMKPYGAKRINRISVVAL